MTPLLWNSTQNCRCKQQTQLLCRHRSSVSKASAAPICYGHPPSPALHEFLSSTPSPSMPGAPNQFSTS
ncbi:hypothetical protein M0R45_018989 [Rubus argutus]|uniref:Uncharacterized protein n=1 Tax=Rubus argutus TaxID=59490 RepID=A0AAW1X4V0_RUBAR